MKATNNFMASYPDTTCVNFVRDASVGYNRSVRQVGYGPVMAASASHRRGVCLVAAIIPFKDFKGGLDDVVPQEQFYPSLQTAVDAFMAEKKEKV